jgi:hypothetical protein
VFLLAFHIIAVGILVVAVWGIAYRLGHRAGERHAQRRLGLRPRPNAGHEPVGETAPDSGSDRA